MKVDIETQAIFDAINNETRPKILSRGWYEENAVNIYDENGRMEDVRRIYRNLYRSGIINVNEGARTLEFSEPISYEEAYWFSRVGLAGGFDDE